MSRPPLILVVDDEPHIVHVLSVKLQSAGFVVRTAMDGRQALRCVVEQAPDLVIADHSMPVADGFELCTGLLHMQKTRFTPVIMLTGKSHNFADKIAGFENIRATIAKPFSPRDVVSKVCELLKLDPGEGVAKAS